MHGQALIAAAVAAFQEGDLARARRLAEEQLARSGQLPLLHHLLGLIDCRMGRFDSGVERLKRAIEGDPANLSYRIILVRALIDAGRAAEALVFATPPKGTSPSEIELLQVRAEAAFYAGDRAIEAEAWGAIANARPQDVMAWTNLGRSLLVQYRFSEAETAYRTALALAPSLTVRHELGLMLERSNQLEQLGELLDASLAEGIAKEALADLWALRALRAGEFEEAVRLAEMIDITPDPFRLNGLRAKIADAADRPPEAFAAATAKNWSVQNRGEWRERGRSYRGQLQSSGETIAQELAELPRLDPPKRQSPAFLVGFPRSGTTLADTFLRGHPDIRVLEEVPVLARAVRTLGGIAKLPEATSEQLAAARDDYFAELDELVEPAFTGLVIDKMPLNMLSLPVIASLFPDAQIIFAQRHPCDCVLSCFMQTFVLTDAMASFLDLTDSADLYDAAMRVFTQASAQLSLPLHWLVYEELVTDPSGVLKPLISFLGLDWRAELLDHRATAARRRAIKTPSYDQRRPTLVERRERPLAAL